MQLQVQLRKRSTIEVMQAQIESVKSGKMTYTISDNGAFYALNITCETTGAYTKFMEKLHGLWREKNE